MILTKENIASINIDQKSDEYIKSGDLNKILFIVPTNRKLRSFKKELIDLSPGQVVSQLNIETLTTISEKLLSGNENFIPLSEAASTVLIKQSAESVKLNYLVNYKDEIPFGTLEKIKNVISEYKRFGIYPERLREEAEKLEFSERAKAIDIAAIYEVYLEKCFALNALEIGDIYSRLQLMNGENFTRSFSEIYPNVNFILINGFDELSTLETDIIDKIASQNDVELYLNFDYYRYNPLIFSHLDKCYNQLGKKGFKKVEDVSSSLLDDFRNEVREKLFVKSSNKKNNSFKEHITKINGRNVEEEVQLIAKEIKELIFINNVKPHDICVVFNLINKYSSLVRDIFDSYGIPVNLTDRIALDNSQPVIALINFLEIAENDFYYKNIFRALNSKYFDTLRVDTSNLNQVASELKIVSGYDNWVNSIKEKIDDLNSTAPEEYHSLSIENYEKALADLALLKSVLSPFNLKQAVYEFHSRLQIFISDSNLGVNVIEEGENAEKNIKGIITFIEVTEELFNLLQLEYDETKKFGLSYFIDQLKTAANWARFNTKERSDLGVTVTSVNEIRGLRFDYLFIGGMNDSVFPTRFSPEIFFAGSFAKQDHIHQTEERYHFYQALCSWKKKLFLSYSLLEDEKELVESTFLKDFESTFGVSKKEWKNYNTTAYNTEDVLIELGRAEVLNSNSKLYQLFGNENYESIKNKIKIEKLRINDPHTVSSFNGFVGQSELNLEPLNSLTQKEFSISQLETYAKCPFKYFAQYILNLSQIEEPSEELEAIEIGSLLHRILYQFYSELSERKLVLKNCSDDDFKKIRKILFDIAEKNLSSPIFNSELTFFEKERILGIGGNRNQSILYKFLEDERYDESDFYPQHFEVSFGSVKGIERDKSLSLDQPVMYNNIKLRGKIDRIDISNENKFNVLDYKLSGKKPTISDIEEGISLQLPVYFFAAENLFKEKIQNVVPQKMYIYSLKYKKGEFGKKPVSLTTKRKVDQTEITRKTIESSLKIIESYVNNIQAGNFPLTRLDDREKKVCGYCNFKEICRVEETEL